MRPMFAAALVAASCAGGGAGPGAASPSPEARGAELARVHCLLVAPLENASGAPLASEAATASLVGAVDPSQAVVYPLADLRALFRDTPLELPEGVPPSMALELAELLGADGALYGAVEGRPGPGGGDLQVTLRLVLTGQRDLVFAGSARVRTAPAEPLEAAVQRTTLALAGPALSRLGGTASRHCFDPEQTRALRTVALAVARPAAPALAPGPAASPDRGQPRTARQADWARRLASAGRIRLDDLAFSGRTPELLRDGVLADLALALASAPEVRVRVEAFVDATHDGEGDARLSAAMARSVLQRLAELGVARERLAWAGRGGASPLVPNFTARGRAANRRIEIVGLR